MQVNSNLEKRSPERRSAVLARWFHQATECGVLNLTVEIEVFVQIVAKSLGTAKGALGFPDAFVITDLTRPFCGSWRTELSIVSVIQPRATRFTGRRVILPQSRAIPHAAPASVAQPSGWRAPRQRFAGYHD